MAVKFQLCLLLIILGITAHAQKIPDLPRCDYPHGVCVYYKDPCPPDTPNQCETDYDCPVSTNKCCCRQPALKPAKRCDWPHGVCSYIYDLCPPDIPYDCRSKYYCPVPKHECCCWDGLS